MAHRQDDFCAMLLQGRVAAIHSVLAPAMLEQTYWNDMILDVLGELCSYSLRTNLSFLMGQVHPLLVARF